MSGGTLRSARAKSRAPPLAGPKVLTTTLAMKSYLLSALKQTFTEEEFRAFARSHRLHWLLWERGAWASRDGEALALPLPSALEEGDQVTLGRAPDCDLTVKDDTVSETHLLLTQDEDGWAVRDAGSANGTWVDGKRLQLGEAARLRNGSRIRAAQVELVHYEPEGLWQRMLRLQLAPSASSDPAPAPDSAPRAP